MHSYKAFILSWQRSYVDVSSHCACALQNHVTRMLRPFKCCVHALADRSKFINLRVKRWWSYWSHCSISIKMRDNSVLWCVLIALVWTNCRAAGKQHLAPWRGEGLVCCGCDTCMRVYSTTYRLPWHWWHLEWWEHSKLWRLFQSDGKYCHQWRLISKVKSRFYSLGY